MQAENVGHDVQNRLIEMLLSQTHRALAEVFQVEPIEAQTLLERFRTRLFSAPLSERIFVLHHDPLTLAADLAAEDLDDDKWQSAVQRYNAERAPTFESPFQMT
ncbi:hypothetical protein [Rhizobium sp. Leaf453]|uniref:hypothetical protein n=1 Tax=Rhizobium sp. Leaf453 TaxID=1736380 RepID=UPI0007146E04|nr:hypothetical protein [Rhizobium sp. Leaf453]KQU08038.1 hypothetical protein ASG68_23565 [Rhizobium sp. Leaf453]